MEGFNILQKSKLILAFKKASVQQIKQIIDLGNSELQRRKKREQRALKNVVAR